MSYLTIIIQDTVLLLLNKTFRLLEVVEVVEVN